MARNNDGLALRDLAEFPMSVCRPGQQYAHVDPIAKNLSQGVYCAVDPWVETTT
jgi:hypothetical protein